MQTSRLHFHIITIKRVSTVPFRLELVAFAVRQRRPTAAAVRLLRACSQFERKPLHVAIMNNVYAKRWARTELKGNGAQRRIGSP